MPALRQVAADLVPTTEREPAQRLAQRYAGASERLAGRPGVSVVLPVYNASTALGRCLEALERTTDPGVPIVLVDDRSSDPAALAACERFAARRPGTDVVVSDVNRGFVATVNQGLRRVDPAHDVVVLNSDTVVTPGWLGKLAVAVYIAPDVASASPLSNAAGVFSLPHEHVDNPLPPGWSAQSCNQLLEEVSEREYEQVPATSGFCLYLRREALAAVGLLDELLLQRGYGEENDFCARASAAGFSHRVDDATFVFHERNASFGGDKHGLKRQNARIVKALHPDHARELRECGGRHCAAGAAGALPALARAARRARAAAARDRARRGRWGRGAAGARLDRGASHGRDGGQGARCEVDLFGVRQLSLRVRARQPRGSGGVAAQPLARRRAAAGEGILREDEAPLLARAWSTKVVSIP